MKKAKLYHTQVINPKTNLVYENSYYGESVKEIMELLMEVYPDYEIAMIKIYGFKGVVPLEGRLKNID